MYHFSPQSASIQSRSGPQKLAYSSNVGCQYTETRYLNCDTSGTPLQVFPRRGTLERASRLLQRTGPAARRDAGRWPLRLSSSDTWALRRCSDGAAIATRIKNVANFQNSLPNYWQNFARFRLHRHRLQVHNFFFRARTLIGFGPGGHPSQA